jgi:hypothetical protein
MNTFPEETDNNRIVGRRVFCAVRVVIDTQYTVKGKQAISSSQTLFKNEGSRCGKVR